MPRLLPGPSLLSLIGLPVWPLLLSSCATGPATSSTSDASELYEGPPKGAFYAPFHLELDPMETLLLINIENDPDKVYIGFEPQTFDDEGTGTGMLVIGYREDGYVDVYHEPHLRLEPAGYEVIGQGLNEMVPTEFRSKHLEIGPTGLDVSVEFTDLLGREVILVIREETDRATRPFSLLAPLGSGTANPPSFPLLLLYDFYFVRRKDTQVEVSINGTAHSLDRLGFPIDGRRVYFTRYSADPFIVWWNRNFDGPLQALEPGEDLEVQAQGATFRVVRNRGYLEIASMSAANEDHQVLLEFSPPIPELASLKVGATVDGEFRITSDPSIGSIAGTYFVERRQSQLLLRLHPSQGWQPNPDRMTLRLIFGMVRIFRTWPKTYQWTATIDLEGDTATMQSQWRRLE